MENELYTIIEDLGKNIHVVPNCRIVPARYFDGGAEKCFFKYDDDLMVFIPNGTVLYERDFKDNPVYVLCSSVNPEDADLYMRYPFINVNSFNKCILSQTPTASSIRGSF